MAWDDMPGFVNAAMDKYSRVKLLGKGSFGKCWLVNERSNGHPWVAKEIKVENRRDLEDALAEAQLLSTLQHEYIVG